jgi:hypothetical protein
MVQNVTAYAGKSSAARRVSRRLTQMPGEVAQNVKSKAIKAADSCGGMMSWSTHTAPIKAADSCGGMMSWSTHTAPIKAADSCGGMMSWSTHTAPRILS